MEKVKEEFSMDMIYPILDPQREVQIADPPEENVVSSNSQEIDGESNTPPTKTKDINPKDWV